MANATTLILDENNIAQPKIITGDVAFTSEGLSTVSKLAITADKIAPGAITSNKIAAGTITIDKLSPELQDLIKVKPKL